MSNDVEDAAVAFIWDHWRDLKDIKRGDSAGRTIIQLLAEEGFEISRKTA